MSFLANYRSLSKSWGARTLFTDITTSFSEGERLGLIGANGSGKSTLLKIFSGVEEPDDGEITLRKLARLVYLPQEDDLDPEKSVEEALYDAVADEIQDTEYQGFARRIIGSSGFSDMTASVGELSGGWRKRLAITRALIMKPDLLFLDEPTNHLDLAGILWLENILARATFSFVLISHDRYLLENATNTTLELGKLYPEGFFRVNGNYSEFLRRREEFARHQLQRESTLANRMRRENEWLSRGPKARATKAQFRIDNARKLGDELDSIKRRNRGEREVGFDFDATRRQTRKLMEARNIGAVVDGSTLFENFNLKLSPGTRLGLLGNNGTGKSTLIQILAGTRKPDSGEVQYADNVKIVMFDQAREQLDKEQSLKMALAPDSDSVTYQGRTVHVVSWAKRFLFTPDQLELPVGRLSGGEQARILIARLMLQPADILLLDEPTNDLDIPSLNVLEETLSEFPGAVVVASHDRYLVERVATGVLGFDGRGGLSTYADLNQWIAALDEKPQKKKKKNGGKEKTDSSSRERKKFTYKHRFELEQIEENIGAAEADVVRFESMLNEGAGDPEKLTEICTLLGEAQEKVDALYSRWEELEALKSADQAG